MLRRDPTFTGTISAVSGSSVSVNLASSVASGMSIIDGRLYRVGQVGSFVRIPQGYQNLYGVVAEIGASAAVDNSENEDTGRWMRVQLIGEVLGKSFERGISQYPNIGDPVHLATEYDLHCIYGEGGNQDVCIGVLSSSESIAARISLNELVTRHSAILGSTGSGKSTTVASLLRSIVGGDNQFPNARVLLLDVHGEYSSALADYAQVYSVDPQDGEKKLYMPFWALETSELLEFLTGGVDSKKEISFTDRIFTMKTASVESQGFAGVDLESMTIDTPVPYSLKKLWYDLYDYETATFLETHCENKALDEHGDAETLTPPKYKPHGAGTVAPYLNKKAHGTRRQLELMRSRLLDRRYDFLLHPGPWEPKLDGTVEEDLGQLLGGWLGGEKPITILDLSAVPSAVLERMIGSILRIVYEAIYWSREKPEGGIERPLLVAMEEAHRYLNSDKKSLSSGIVQKIAKEGRKYGIGAMIVSQRPSEVDETILSQCGTFVALRLSNPNDRSRVKGTMPDGLASLLDALPILRTGEAIVTGEASKLPMRCRVALPEERYRPRSVDPKVSEKWKNDRQRENYDGVVASWRAQKPHFELIAADETEGELGE